ncbi:DUF87 domain-containing protein [Demequina sp.]|uniref:ATP-binding protein n=1 Tax=Demequina sp. TaxID=2050685 RepID=UPI0025B966B4|nr:DUF87 domain-containing protein [Demequina sp.]
MRIRLRLWTLVLAFLLLVGIGRSVSGGFGFLIDEFWFTAGGLLFLLLSLVDQPFFSKDANIFVNAATGWVSLLLVPETMRSAIWWGFGFWCIYLLISSYALMWLRSKPLHSESALVQTVSRVNRQLGRPEALFSAFFLWGVFLQYASRPGAASALFLFWAVFMIINLPALAGAIDSAFDKRTESRALGIGRLERTTSPRIAEVRMLFDAPQYLVGRRVALQKAGGSQAAIGVVFDDRIVAGARFARVGITSVEGAWGEVGDLSHGPTDVHLVSDDEAERVPLGVVDSGSEIGTLVFHMHPDLGLKAGDVVVASTLSAADTYFQVVAAVVDQQPLPDGNAKHSIRISAGQLGSWDPEASKFEPVPEVARPGSLIYLAAAMAEGANVLPDGSELLGHVPNSGFPVHVGLDDVVTHNVALLGVTGSGKSFLAFRLIEAMASRNIKVLILDPSRQHDLYLGGAGPTALRTSDDVRPWIEGASPIGIHQFGVDQNGYPRITRDFVKAVFDEVSKTKLVRGKDMPAQLCVVLEEAHSLIPEWTQVAQKEDSQHVNATGRYILQGRKFGMGVMVISQRTANVTKTILNQCNTIFALQSFDQTGLDFLRNYMGDGYSQAISTLPRQHAVLVGKASSSGRPILFQIEDMADRWSTDSPAPAPATDNSAPDGNI